MFVTVVTENSESPKSLNEQMSGATTITILAPGSESSRPVVNERASDMTGYCATYEVC